MITTVINSTLQTALGLYVLTVIFATVCWIGQARLMFRNERRGWIGVGGYLGLFVIFMSLLAFIPLMWLRDKYEEMAVKGACLEVS